MSDGHEKDNMKNVANKPISKKERLRRAALRMRNQQPSTRLQTFLDQKLFRLMFTVWRAIFRCESPRLNKH